jgi:rhamnosyltransferase
MDLFRFVVIVPTYNAGPVFSDWIVALQQQTVTPDAVLVVDSSSSDRTAELARDAGFNVERISRQNFNHGRTRQQALSQFPDTVIVVYLTQDAILADNTSLENLINAFSDESVGAAYGRQLPRKDANPIEAHARIFNYPNESQIKSLEDSTKLGGR